MDIINAFQTKDGKVFTSEKDAIKHIEKSIGDILVPICHKIVTMKYAELSEFIYNEIDDFVAISNWKSDLLKSDEREFYS